MANTGRLSNQVDGENRAVTEKAFLIGRKIVHIVLSVVAANAMADADTGKVHKHLSDAIRQHEEGTHTDNSR